MFLRRNRRVVDGESYEYWSLVETYRTAKGPRQRVVASLGLEGHFLAHPTAFFAELKTPAGREVFVVRAEPGERDLGKLVRIQATVRAVADGSLPLEAAAAEVRALVAEKPRFGPAATLAAFTLSSSLAARFFGGGWREMVLGGLLGFAVGVLGTFTARVRHLAEVFVLLAASLACTARTPRVFCAVSATITEVPKTPNCWNVLRSAWIPAPPPESEPAMVSAICMESVPVPCP